MMRLLLVLLLLSQVVACSQRVPDAEAIRGSVAAMAEAAEAKRTAEVLEHVAADFTGNDGELDRAGLERMLRARVLAAQAVGVSIGAVEVELDGDRATARFEMTVTDGSGRWLSGGRAVLQVTSGWRRDGGDWHCYNAKWTQG